MEPSAATASSAKPTYPIGSVDSALKLLLMVSEREHVRIAEASQELGVARSTAHRLMQMLQYYGFVGQEPESKAYVVGPALIDLGLRVVRDLDIRTIAHPFIAELVEELEETVHLLAFQQDDATCLDSVESPRALRVGARTGMVLPAYATAGGRALLAAMPRDRIRKLYPGSRLPRVNPNTISTRRELEEALEQVRDRGYAVQRGELEEDVSAVGTAIKDSRGSARFAIAVAIPTSRLLDDQIPAIGDAAMRTAERISEALPW